VSSPHAPTFWWGNFLLVAQVPDPSECEVWLDRFAGSFPGATHVAIGFDKTAGTLAELAWFVERGFSAEALAVMTAAAPPGAVRLNRDAVYRELRSDDDWAKSVELRRRCTSEERAMAWSADLDTARALTNRQIVDGGHGRWFGAFDDDRLVAQLGLVAAGAGLARFQSVETDPDFRRRGLATALVDHYRALGFETAETQLMVERKPATAPVGATAGSEPQPAARAAPGRRHRPRGAGRRPRA
jgi:GNAT superfamily N-acetyltransferase